MHSDVSQLMAVNRIAVCLVSALGEHRRLKASVLVVHECSLSWVTQWLK
ncbi:MAG: hypothetical protein ACRCUH_01820 [Shewanella sp.]